MLNFGDLNKHNLKAALDQLTLNSDREDEEKTFDAMFDREIAQIEAQAELKSFCSEESEQLKKTLEDAIKYKQAARPTPNDIDDQNDLTMMVDVLLEPIIQKFKDNVTKMVTDHCQASVRQYITQVAQAQRHSSANHIMTNQSEQPITVNDIQELGLTPDVPNVEYVNQWLMQ